MQNMSQQNLQAPLSSQNSFALPNVRKMFIPDRGKVIVDVDLSGADAQVVAWEADDAKLKEAFRAGKSVHLMNGEDLLGPMFTNAPGHHKRPGTEKGKMYEALKRFVHGTNYLGSAKTLSENPSILWPLADCVRRQRRWLDELHPGIRGWHKRVQECLHRSRSIRNQFGYRIVYFDRIDSVLSQAVAWGPQSTVAEVCFRGGLQLRKLQWVELLLQVHDSLVFQIPTRLAGEASTLDTIRRHLEVVVPYPDPLIIPWGIAMSDKNWGECK